MSWRDVRAAGGLAPLLIVGLITLLGTVDQASFPNVLPAIAQDLQADPANLFNVVAFAIFVGLLAALGVGWWADRHRRVPLMGIGTILSSVAGTLQARATGTMGVGLPRAAGYAGISLSGVPQYSLLADYYPSRFRGRVFGLIGMLTTIGLLVAVPLSAVLVTWLGWRTAVVVISAPGVALGVAALHFLREPIRGYHEKREQGLSEEAARTEDRPQSFGEAWRATFAVRTLRRLFVASMLF